MVESLYKGFGEYVVVRSSNLTDFTNMDYRSTIVKTKVSCVPCHMKLLIFDRCTTAVSERFICLRYEGTWFNDQRHGQGKYWYASGAVYDGGWEHGKMHGMGCYTSASSSRFEGKFK